MIIRSQSKLLYKSAFVLAIFALLTFVNGATAMLSIIPESPQEREIKILKSPLMDTAVTVSITAIRNLQNRDWLSDLEIEVRNNSKKPIYYLSMDLLFPDIPKTNELDGIPRGIAIPLSYGRPDLMQQGRFATSEDAALSPGEKYVFKIPESDCKGLLSFMSKKNYPLSMIKKIRLSIISISFGDGTGFAGGGPFSFNEKFILSFSRNKDEPVLKRAVALFNNDQITCSMNASFTSLILKPANLISVSGIPVPNNSGSYNLNIQSTNCGPYNSGCGHYQQKVENCSPDGTCKRRWYQGLQYQGPCMKITSYNIHPCTSGGFPYYCVLDTAYACEVIVHCGLNCDTGDCISCSATWDPATCTCSNDRDNDGWTIDEGDCDDNNPHVHPDIDGDGDGVSVCEECDDTDDTVYPGAPENCTDGIDNNCNGLIDDQDPDCEGDSNCGNTQEEIDCYLYAGIWDQNLCRCDYTSPILIDTQGNGFNLTKASGGVNFDLKPDGFAERIAWTTAGSDDAFLVLDRNGNSSIDNGTELFGNFTPQPASPKPNGFIALAEYNKPARGETATAKSAVKMLSIHHCVFGKM